MFPKTWETYHKDEWKVTTTQLKVLKTRHTMNPCVEIGMVSDGLHPHFSQKYERTLQPRKYIDTEET